MQHLPNQTRTNQELISIFKIVMETALSRDLHGSRIISGPVFDKVSQELYGSSIRGVVRGRFAKRGSQTGFNDLKKELGYQILPHYSREEIIEIYYDAYCRLKDRNDRKDPWPRETDITQHPISMHAVYTKFGTHLNAVREMARIKKVQREVLTPATVVLKRRDRVGEDISKYGIGLKQAPTNEMGVVAIFSEIYSHLGFSSIIKIQQEFPDCVAECVREKDTKFRAKIEFKMYSATAFKKRSQRIEAWKAKEVDYLICWENNSAKVTGDLLGIGIGTIALKNELEGLYHSGLLGKKLGITSNSIAS